MRHLLPYATERQAEIINAVLELGSRSKAAKALNLNKRNVYLAISKVRDKAALSGISPEHDMVHAAPPTHIAKGVSTLYDNNGEVKQQWVKLDIDRDAQLKLLKESIIDAFSEEIKPRARPAVAKSKCKDIISAYVIGDAHIGMYAWDGDTSDSHNLKQAKKDLYSAADRLISSSPDSHECLIINVGDFIHCDDYSNATKKNKNPLDVDGRYGEIIRAGIEIQKYVIDRALEKHKKVIVMNAQGNHDEQTAVFISIAMQLYYEKVPQVEIMDNDSRFLFYEYGKNLIGVTHGDTVKSSDLESLMAAIKPQEWGRTEFRYWITGHIHHEVKKEYRGCVTESFRTLAPKDYWHESEGYVSGREMNCIVYHKDYGEEERHTAGIKRIRHG